MQSTFSVLPHELIVIIFEYASLGGTWKYACKDTLKIAINGMLEYAEGGDDIHTDNLWLTSKINMSDVRVRKRIMKEATTRLRVKTLMRHIVLNNLGFVQPILDAMKLPFIDEKFVFMISRKGIFHNHHSGTDLLNALIAHKFYKTVNYYLFESESVIRDMVFSRSSSHIINDYIETLINQPDMRISWSGRFIEPYEMYSIAGLCERRNLLMVRRFGEALINTECKPFVVKRYVSAGYHLYHDYRHLPTNPHILALVFEGLPIKNIAATITDWEIENREDVVDIVFNNPDLMPELVGHFIDQIRLLDKVEFDLRIDRRCRTIQEKYDIEGRMRVIGDVFSLYSLLSLRK